jgi:hypothetical protein
MVTFKNHDCDDKLHVTAIVIALHIVGAVPLRASNEAKNSLISPGPPKHVQIFIQAQIDLSFVVTSHQWSQKNPLNRIRIVGDHVFLQSLLCIQTSPAIMHHGSSVVSLWLRQMKHRPSPTGSRSTYEPVDRVSVLPEKHIPISAFFDYPHKRLKNHDAAQLLQHSGCCL